MKTISGQAVDRIGRTLAVLLAVGTLASVAGGSVLVLATPPQRLVPALLAWLQGARFEGRGAGVRQHGPADCGPAALADCLRRLGVLASREELVERVEPGKRGTSLDALGREARRRGVPASRVFEAGRSPAALSALGVPAILHVRPGESSAGHFVVWAGWREGRAVVHDPALGELSYPEPVLRRLWTGHALRFDRGPGPVGRSPLK